MQIKDLQAGEQVKAKNVDTLRSRPVLILVTGDWAQHISLEGYSKTKGNIDKIPSERYDHFERLGAVAKSAESSEVTKAYRVLEYHCTISTYTQGEKHDWALQGVSPMLSDIVLLPRLLQEHRLKYAIHALSRAVRKTLRDSLILAGEVRYREETWELKTPYTECE